MADSVVVLPSAARTTSVNSPDFRNERAENLIVSIDVTAKGTNVQNVFTIQGKDTVANKYYTILSSAIIAATGTTQLRVGPNLTAATNLVAKDILPPVWRVAVTASGDSMTYSIYGGMV